MPSLKVLYATGSGGFGAMLRVKAKRRGFKLNRYGLFDRDSGKLVAAATERAIFTALDKRFYHPTERR
jgi:DNA polymerase (family 10)